jgi:hypothetical protein
MRLMQRPQITTLALPRSSTWPSELLPPHQAPFHFLPDIYVYAKFMLATPSYLIDNLTRELSELASERRILSSLDDPLGIAFCDAAEQRLHAQIAKAAALDTEVLRFAIDRALQLQRDIATSAALQAQRTQERECAPTPDLSDVPTHYLSTQTQHSISHSPSPTPTPRGPKSRKNLNPPPPSTSAYYYYQAASGQPIFLHPLDIRILSAHFGAYAAFPDSIMVRVEAASEGSVAADFRRRCKYLSHIPESADVVFVEADLKGVVGAEGLRAFEGAIKARRARRREKGRRDERARIRAEEREREKLTSAAAAAAAWTTSSRTVTGGSVAWGTTTSQDHELVADLELEPEVSPSPSATTGSPQAQQEQQGGGVWGARSFAAAANAGRGAASTGIGRTPVRAVRHDAEDADAEVDADEWAFELDLDRAWHELEMQQRGSGGGGGRRRKTRMVVLGSGGSVNSGAGGRRR